MCGSGSKAASKTASAKSGLKAKVPGQDSVSKAPAKAIVRDPKAAAAAKKEQEKYLARVLEHSRDQNLSAQIRASAMMDEVDLSSWSLVRDMPENVLAEATWESKKKSAEQDEIDAQQDNYPIFDVNTLRELPLLEHYFSENNPLIEHTDHTRERVSPALGKQGPLPYPAPGSDTNDPVEKRNQEKENIPVLRSLADSILSFDLKPESLTDDYLSRHVHEILDYAFKLQYYNNQVLTAHSYFLAELNEEEKLTLKTRAVMAKPLFDFLEAHLSAHGLYIFGSDDKSIVGINYIPEHLLAIRANHKGQLVAHCEELRQKFIRDAWFNAEVTEARSSAYDAAFRSGNVLAELEKRKGDAGDVGIRACGDEIALATGEIKKALEYRDMLFEEQKILLGKLVVKSDESDDKAEKKEKKPPIIDEAVLEQIYKNNRMIRLMTRHADHYREFIEFGIGNRETLSDDTRSFLSVEKQDAMLAVLRYREGLNALNRAAALSKGSDLKGFREVSSKDFLTSLAAAKAKIESIRDILEQGRKNRTAALDAAKALAEKNALVKIENKGFSGTFIDAKMDPETYKWVVLATQYEATADTPAEFKREIAEKGVVPFLTMIDAITEDNIDKMRVEPDTSVGSEEYWKNRTILGLLSDGANGSGLLELLRKHDIPISGERYEKIVAMGSIARGMYAEYEFHDEKMSDPLTVLAADPDYADRLEAIRKKLPDKSVNSGLAIKRAVADVVRMRRKKDVAPEDLGVRIAKIHLQYLRNGLQGETDKLKRFVKTEELALFAGYRLALKEEMFEDRFPASPEVIEKWNSRLDGIYGDLNNIILFGRFLRKVQKDRNGSPLDDPESRANYEKNNRDMEDFISGDTERRNRVLRDIGYSVLYGTAEKKADAKIPAFDPRYADFEYIHEHYLEVRDYCLKMEAFKKYYRMFADIFDGEMFTEEERQAFKTNIVENTHLTALIRAIRDFPAVFGMNGQGDEVELSKDTIEEERNRLKGLLTGDLSKMTLKTVRSSGKKDADKPKPGVAGKKASDQQISEFGKFKRAWDGEIIRLSRAHYDEVLRRRANGSFRTDKEEARYLSELKYENDQKVSRMLAAKQKLFPEIDRCMNGELKPSDLSPDTLQFVYENGISMLSDRVMGFFRFGNEKIRMGKFYENDAQVNLRIKLKDTDRAQREAMPEDLKLRWREKFGRDAKGIGDPEIFSRFLMPVSRDWVGRPLNGSEANDRANREIIEAFLNDDREGITVFLKKLGTEMARNADQYSANLTMKTLEKNSDEAGYMACVKADLFGTVYTRYMDFFESDAFSPQEKAALRMMADDSQLNKYRKAYWVALMRQIGLQKDLSDMNPPGSDVEMRAVKGRALRKMDAVASSLAGDKAKQQEVRAAYSGNNGPRLDSLSSLMAPQVVKTQKTGDPEAKKRAGLFGEIRKLLLGYTQYGGAVKDLSPENKTFMGRFLDRFRKKDRTVPKGGHWTLTGRRSERPDAPEKDEEAELKVLRESNKDADLGTVRVKRIMERYFAETPHKVFGEDGRATDTEIRVYLDHLLKRKFYPDKMDDEYLMIHAAELYELSQSFKDITWLEQNYPAYFAALSGKEREELCRRVDYATFIDKVLNRHFIRHRISVANGKVDLTPEERSRDGRTLRDRLALFDSELAKAVNVFKGRFSGADTAVENARVLGQSRSFVGGYEMSYIKRLKSPGGAAGGYVTRLSTALQQAVQQRNASRVELLNKVHEFEGLGRNQVQAKTQLKAQIDAEVKTVLEESDIISEYFDLLRFAAGDIPFISDDKVRAMGEKKADGSVKDTIGIYREMVADLVIEAGQAIESEEKKAAADAVQDELKAKVDAIAAGEMAKKMALFKAKDKGPGTPKAPEIKAATAAAATAAAATAAVTPAIKTVAEGAMPDKRPAALKKDPEVPAEEAPLEKAPVEEAPVVTAPVETPAPEAPVEEAPQEKKEKDKKAATPPPDPEVPAMAAIPAAATVSGVEKDAAEKERVFWAKESEESFARVHSVKGKGPRELIYYTSAAKNRVLELMSQDTGWNEYLSRSESELGIPLEIPTNRAEAETLIESLKHTTVNKIDYRGQVARDSKNEVIRASGWEEIGVKAQSCLRWLRNYYSAFENDAEADEAEEHMEDYLEVVRDLHVEVHYSLPYELQGTNNCYCCTGAALFNQYAMNADGKETLTQGEMVTQTMLRDFLPEGGFRPIEEFAEMYREGLTEKDSEIEIKEGDLAATYFSAIGMAEDFMGPGKDMIGSLFEIGDAFFRKRTDMAMYRMKIATPALQASTAMSVEEKRNTYVQQKVEFLRRVAGILSTGNLVGILIDNKAQMKHYRTITAVHGNMLTVMDSLYPEQADESVPAEETLHPGQTYSVPVEDLLRQLYRGNSVELTWFEKIEDPKKLAEKLPVSYSAGEGFTTTDDYEPTIEVAMNVAQLNGILCGVEETIPKAETAVYIPKKYKKQ